jgi:RimJ/RimL family protein N-acetyltransferase
MSRAVLNPGQAGQHDASREGAGFSFAMAEADTGRAVGGIGLWLASLAHGRATAGYSVAPTAQARGVAAAALTALTPLRGTSWRCTGSSFASCSAF